MVVFTGLIAGVLALSAGDFTDRFDTYADGTKLHWLNGWHGWDNDANSEGVVRSTFARSGGRSVDTGGAADLVQNFTATGGKWQVKTYQYIPSSATGSNTYFILMNTYVDGGAKSWSTQVIFNLSTNLVYDNMGGSSGSAPLIRDQWVPIEVQVDLDLKTQDIYYNGVKFTTVPWNRMGGAAAIAAVDLYGSTISHVYYDDFTLRDLTHPSVDVVVNRWREVTSDE